MTPPWHGPNARYIDGWNFLPMANAPKEHREFMFSPEVGDTITWDMVKDSDRGAALLDRIKRFGRGELHITDYQLTAHNEGGQVGFQWMEFEARLSWPANYKTREWDRDPICQNGQSEDFSRPDQSVRDSDRHSLMMCNPNNASGTCYSFDVPILPTATSVVLQASSDLVNWEDVAVYASESAVNEVVRAPEPGFAKRFFRIKVVNSDEREMVEAGLFPLPVIEIE